jgi:hypothetical protein
MVYKLFEICSIFLFFFLFNISFWLPKIYSQWFLSVTKNVGLIKLFDTSLCWLYVIVKNVSNLIIWKTFSINLLHMFFQFDWSNFTNLRKLSFKFLLSHFLWNKSNENVRFEGFFLVLINRVGTSYFWL